MAKPCYFQGCENRGTTKEHIPPRAFFPAHKRNQLLTVPSCAAHNGDKSGDDQYALAHICINASPASDSREIFMNRIARQLDFNNEALRLMLRKDAIDLENGVVAYAVDSARLDHFFTALSCGIVYNVCGAQLPSNYGIGHVYHNFHDESQSPEEAMLHTGLLEFYGDDREEDLLKVLDFGQAKTLNETIYSARIFGFPNFGSSITIVHRFFGTFRVTSMLTNRVAATDRTNV